MICHWLFKFTWEHFYLYLLKSKETWWRYHLYLIWLVCLRSSTVTRLDVIFRYPDRVPLTHFVHRAKKVFGMWAWIFCWVFCATGIFRRCNKKIFEHRVGPNLPPSDYDPGVLPLRHCSLGYRNDIHSVPCWDFPAISVVTWNRIFRPYLVVTCRDFLAVSAVTGSQIFRPYL